jgi:hypothetical protein
MTELLKNTSFDLLLVAALVLVVVVADILPVALRRRREGGALFQLSDLRQRAHVLVLVPFAALIVFQQNILAFFGYEIRDDVPYFLGILLVLVMAAVVLVWMQRKKD